MHNDMKSYKHYTKQKKQTQKSTYYMISFNTGKDKTFLK